jgi:large subunit ribosomal protein L15
VKLHDLKPAPGAHRPKRRVGRGIAAGRGKTAGRGTKGQKARAGGGMPAWFEGGQTPLHQRIPKLRGFRNPFRIPYEIVNVGDIARLVELGVLEPGEIPSAKPARGGKSGKTKAAAPITVNQEILRAAGLVRTLDRPMKVLGSGELSTALFVVADAFSATARAKIEAAGGTASVIEVPGTKAPALGVQAGPATDAVEGPSTAPALAEAAAPAERLGEPGEAVAQPAEPVAAADASAERAVAAPATKPRATRRPRAATPVEPVEDADAPASAPAEPAESPAVPAESPAEPAG